MSRIGNAQTKQKKTWLVPTIVVVVAALLIVTVLFLNRDSADGTANAGSAASGEQLGPEMPAPAQAPQEPATPDLTAVETREESDPLAVGPVDAPVGLVVFSDYQCPYCAKWNHDTLPTMMEHVEAGDLRIEWRDLNVFGPASERASRAAYAAALQGKFMEYHHALFADGEHRSEDELSDEALISLAEEQGLDAEQFTSDFNSDETAQAVAGNAQLGADLGAYSTPAFLLGGQPLMGAQPTQVFENTFQAALEGAK